MSDKYSLALPFDTYSHEFVMGVEVGRLWEQFKWPGEWEQTFHAENAEMVMRIVEITGRPVVIEHTDDPAWMHIWTDEWDGHA